MEKKKICIVGLGYIGLPTAATFAQHGFEVVGVDINTKVVEALNEGRIIIEEPNLDSLVKEVVKSGNLVGKTEPEEADCFIICVPTPITEEKTADMKYVVSATELIVPYVRKGNVVVLESTSPTGTVDELMQNILSKTGLVIGEELYLGYSPERVLPGRILYEIINNNRIVGGINRISAEKIKEFYSAFVKGEIYITDSKTAEMCKMMENTYRDFNIALANELAKLCEKIGINAWEVIQLCNKHPRVNIHQPGPGVGGHCLAVDPWFIVEKYPETANLIRLAREVNDSMPEYVYNNVLDILGGLDVKGIKKVVVLGMTYKPDVDDIRESPVVHLIELLKNRPDIEVVIYDPHVEKYNLQGEDLYNAVEGSDLMILGVNHSQFKELRYNQFAEIMRNKIIYDTRNFLDEAVLTRAGFKYYLLGKKF